MKSETYDLIKKYGITIIAALGILYAALSKLWGWPYTAEICGTLAAIETFLTTILNTSSKKYWKEVKENERNCSEL